MWSIRPQRFIRLVDRASLQSFADGPTGQILRLARLLAPLRRFGLGHRNPGQRIVGDEVVAGGCQHPARRTGHADTHRCMN